MIIDPNLQDMIKFIYHKLRDLNSSGGSGGITPTQLATALASKVDIVAGKGLSTNDYTNADKSKVNTIGDKLDKGTYNGTAQDLKNAIDTVDSKTIYWNDVQNKPNFDYLPLTGGTINGNITSDNFKKKNSTNDKVLLGGGGDISLSELKNENIKIGGRNYYSSLVELGFYNSLTLLKRNFEGFSVRNVNNGELRISKVIKENNYWTCSFKIKVLSGNGKIKVDICDGLDHFFDVTTDFKTFKITEKITNSDNIFNFIDITFIDGGDYYIEDLKIEKGNVATDWTPAPEDIESTISADKVSDSVNNAFLAEASGKEIVFSNTTDVTVSLNNIKGNTVTKIIKKTPNKITFTGGTYLTSNEVSGIGIFEVYLDKDSKVIIR